MLVGAVRRVLDGSYTHSLSHSSILPMIDFSRSFFLSLKALVKDLLFVSSCGFSFLSFLPSSLPVCPSILSKEPRAFTIHPLVPPSLPPSLFIHSKYLTD
mmetsp:Transcript_13690/g.27235  ORF Transcript_13690/g.27235 Transcript_13690/m.27235 type:complete len:100 (-) Transcript_13690:801-1100(-)